MRKNRKLLDFLVVVGPYLIAGLRGLIEFVAEKSPNGLALPAALLLCVLTLGMAEEHVTIRDQAAKYTPSGIIVGEELRTETRWERKRKRKGSH